MKEKEENSCSPSFSGVNSWCYEVHILQVTNNTTKSAGTLLWLFIPMIYAYSLGWNLDFKKSARHLHQERLPWCHLSGTLWNSVWLLERSHATALPQVPGNQTILESSCILVVEKQAEAGRQIFATWLLLPCRWSSRKRDRRLAGTQQSWISCTFTIKQSKLLLFIWVWNCTKMAVTFQTSEKRSCWLGRLLIYLSFAVKS